MCVHADGNASAGELQSLEHAGWMQRATERRYADLMSPEPPAEALVLVLDTCAERASLALFHGPVLLQESLLEERAASIALLGAMRSTLQANEVDLRDLACVGVVSGPGSFTGVRVGLAVAKGLCEASAVPLAAVSRLAVLGEAAGLVNGLALLHAGRDQVYVRDLTPGNGGREWLASVAEIDLLCIGRDVAVAQAELAPRFAQSAAEIRTVKLTASHAFSAVQRCLAAGGSDLAATDPNYVRSEEAIYAKTATR